MKKILLAFAVASASLMTLNSCTKEYITNYLPGVSYTPTISPDKWSKLSDNSNIYLTTLDFRELDRQYYETGTVQVALEFNHAKGIYNAIPATINGIHYSFEYRIGSINILAEILPGGTTLDIDSNIKAKITLTDADNGGN